MISLSAITIPVFLDTDTDPTHLLRHWARLYHYGHIYMPTVCVTTCGLYAYTALSKRVSSRIQWRIYAIAGVTTITMVPFTWLIMVPTNDKLFQLKALGETTASEVDMNNVQDIVMTWVWLHVIRSLFPLVGAILGLLAVLQEVGR